MGSLKLKDYKIKPKNVDIRIHSNLIINRNEGNRSKHTRVLKL